MIKKERPVRVNPPKERTFIARCRRATRNKLPPNIRLRKPCTQRTTSRNIRQRPPAAVQQQGQGLDSILKVAKGVIKNPVVKKLGRGALNEPPNLYNKGTSRIQKKLKKKYTAIGCY